MLIIETKWANATLQICGDPPKMRAIIISQNAGCPRNRAGTGSGTVGTVFPETERGTRTVGTVLQELKPEPEPSLSQGRKTMTATDVTGFDAIFSTGFFAPRF